MRRTLLRCYTSQRGIEGSNPSSSAPEAPLLQEEAMAKNWARSDPGPYYTTSTPTRPGYPLPAPNAAIAIVDLYPPHYKFVVASSVQAGLAQPESICTSTLMQITGMDFGELSFHALR